MLVDSWLIMVLFEWNRILKYSLKPVDNMLYSLILTYLGSKTAQLFFILQFLFVL